MASFVRTQTQLTSAMKKKPPISDEDLALFRQEMQSVRALNFDSKGVHHRPKPPVPVLRPIPCDDLNFPLDDLSDHSVDSTVEANDLLFFSRPGLQHRQLLKLRKGRFHVGGELDLHGLNSNTARQRLMHFIAQCRKESVRCVRIIHGKGLGSKQSIPVLKNRVNTWLQQLDAVLAFCSAPAGDGGTGAVYVLLKK